MGKPPGCGNRAKKEVGQETCTRGLPSGGGRADTDTIARNRELRGYYEQTVADAGITEDAEGPHTVRPGSPRSTIIGNISSIEASSSLLNWLPVGTVKEDTVVPLRASAVSADICFSCGIWTHMTENCRTLNESFPFLPMGWRAERVGDQFILDPGSPAGPEDHEMGNDDWSGERGWSPRPAMPTDPNPQ